MSGHHRPTSETPFKWRFTDRLMMASFQWYLEPLFPRQLKKMLDTSENIEFMHGFQYIL